MLSCLPAQKLAAQNNPDKERAIGMQYFRNGDYEKAIETLTKLYNQNPSPELYYTLLQSYEKIKNFKAMEDLASKQMRRFKTEFRYRVDYGYTIDLQGKADKAKQVYENIIKDLPAEQSEIEAVADIFTKLNETQYAILTYDKGEKLLRIPELFAVEKAKIYFAKKDFKQGVAGLIRLMSEQGEAIQDVYNFLMDQHAEPAIFAELETQLYTKIQGDPSTSMFVEALIWLLIQQHNFDDAFIQVAALDKRFNEDGFRMLNLASAALMDEQFDAAIKALQYVVDKGNKSPYQTEAQGRLLQVGMLKIVKSKIYTQQDLIQLEQSFQSYLNRFGITATTASQVKDLAMLQAKYLGKTDSAISLLQTVMNIPSVNRTLKNEIKIDLGDYYIFQGDFWESTLLYSQVDKDEKDGPIGELARFKNAKLSYYKGEFEWSQAQLNVLKGSTSELIANDALQLSVFILDNLGMDSITLPLEIFASAELLYFQNKLPLVYDKLDSIDRYFPGHKLGDDILFLKSQISMDKREFEQAAEMLDKILQTYSTDILADDAAFQLAELYDFTLKNKSKASEYYLKIITEYKDSVYLTEARKRYRILRGDKLEE